jgi:hypothetical protein
VFFHGINLGLQGKDLLVFDENYLISHPCVLCLNSFFEFLIFLNNFLVLRIHTGLNGSPVFLLLLIDVLLILLNLIEGNIESMLEAMSLQSVIVPFKLMPKIFDLGQILYVCNMLACLAESLPTSLEQLVQRGIRTTVKQLENFLIMVSIAILDFLMRACRLTAL